MQTTEVACKSPQVPRRFGEISDEGSDNASHEYYAACSLLVTRIRSGDSGAMGDFYDCFCGRTSRYLRRRLGTQDVADLTHDAFLAVVEAILQGELRDPARLMGFAGTVLKRKIAAHLNMTMRRRKYEKDITEQVSIPDTGIRPDQAVERRERTQVMSQALTSLSSREREILDRFYLQEQSATRIRSEMRLTGTNYRILKSRAKAKFGKTGQHWLHSQRLRNPLPSAALPLGACA